MRNGKILIAVLIVIGGIIVLLPTIGGYIFKRNYFSLVENINTDNHYKVTIQQYNEGWFSSEATLNVLIRQNHFMPMTSLLVNQTIKHGPFIHGRAGFTAGLAEIDTRLPLANLIANPSLTKQLVDVFLQADTLATFNGQWLSHFQIPALQLLLPNQIKVLAQALSGEIKFATSNKFINQVETSLQLGTVELQTQNNLFGRIIIQPSQLSSQSIRQASGIWNLTSHLTCPGFSLVDLNKNSIQFNNIVHSFSYGSSASDEMSTQSSMTIKSINIPHAEIHSITDVDVGYDALHFDLPAIIAANQFIESKANEPINMLTATDYLNLLVHTITPKSTLDFRINGNTNLGVGLFNIKFYWPTGTSPASIFDVMTHLAANAKVTLSIPLVNQVISLWTQHFAYSIANAQNDKLAVPTSTLAESKPANVIFNQKVANLLQHGEITLPVSLQVMDLSSKGASAVEFAAELKKLDLTPTAENELNQQYAAQAMSGTFPTPPQAQAQRINPSQLQSEMAQKIQQNIDQMIQQGYLSNGNNEYQAQISFENGGMKINGHTYPPPIPTPTNGIPAGVPVSKPLSAPASLPVT